MKTVLPSILAVGLYGAGLAAAATSTANFNVQLTIVSECVINSATDLDFGTRGVLAANVDATSTITVQCTSGTPYTLGLSLGSGPGASAALRYMTGPSAQTVGYSLYQDASHSLVWGPSVGVNTIAGTGNGAAQPRTVYGRIAPQTTPGAGAYADVITATVTY